MGHLIEETIKSCLLQDYNPIEIIVVDDGSTDKTYSVIKSYLYNQTNPKGVQISYFGKKNQGRSSAVNLGIDIAKGEYVTMLDADDTLPKDSIELRVNYLEKNYEKESVFGSTAHINKKGKKYSIKLAPQNNSEEELIKKFLFGSKTPFDCASLMYRDSVFKKIGGFDLSIRRAEDQDFILRLLKKCKIGGIPELVYNYHMTSHHLKNRVRNRLIGIGDKSKVIKRNSSGLMKHYLVPHNFIIQSAKLGYELFTSKK